MARLLPSMVLSGASLPRLSRILDRLIATGIVFFPLGPFSWLSRVGTTFSVQVIFRPPGPLFPFPFHGSSRLSGVTLGCLSMS